MKCLDGIKIKEKLQKEICEKIKTNHWNLTIAIIQVGNYESSKLYLKNKEKFANSIGVHCKIDQLKESITEEELIHHIRKLNNNPKIDGIILQSPTPKHINFEKTSQEICCEKDLDGLNPDSGILPCTVKAILKILEEYKISLQKKKVTIIGRSTIVGKPLSNILSKRKISHKLCHSKTKNIEEVMQKSDVIISATPIPNMISKDMVKEGFIGIDVAICKIEDKIVGNFQKETYEKSSYITPVPGGIGPLTVAMIFENLIELKEKQEKSRNNEKKLI